MWFDKVDILEKEVNNLKNRYEQLRVKLGSHIDRRDIHKGRKTE